MVKLIAQGAEAKIFLTDKLSKKLNGKIINVRPFILKNRVQKSYRHPTLDKQIRTRRTRSEAKLLSKALLAKANVPKVLVVDKFEIQIEYLKGDRLSESLNEYKKAKQIKVMKNLGKQVAILHKNNLIHGDLTTSNVILKEGKVFIIDFGLGFVSTKIEDKAVDLHLIKQALIAKHFRSPDHLQGQNSKELFPAFIKGYKHEESEKILERLEVVEKRGRYKH